MGLSAAQREAFRERGFFSLGKPFAPAELAEIGAEYDRLLARAAKIGEPGRTPFDARQPPARADSAPRHRRLLPGRLRGRRDGRAL